MEFVPHGRNVPFTSVTNDGVKGRERRGREGRRWGSRRQDEGVVTIKGWGRHREKGGVGEREGWGVSKREGRGQEEKRKGSGRGRKGVKKREAGVRKYKRENASKREKE
jgi:hypothetical protein